MATLSFKARFADRVQRGDKRHSIRGPRKRPQDWLPGKRLHLFTGMRTKHCRKLGTGEILNCVDIHLDIDHVAINGHRVPDHELDAFAVSDGFNDWADMVLWWNANNSLPFDGVLISWVLI